MPNNNALVGSQYFEKSHPKTCMIPKSVPFFPLKGLCQKEGFCCNVCHFSSKSRITSTKKTHLRNPYVSLYFGWPMNGKSSCAPIWWVVFLELHLEGNRNASTRAPDKLPCALVYITDI